MKILALAGTRPTFVKLAPIVDAFAVRDVAFQWCHSGQHYSAELDAQIRAELGMPLPYANLHVNGGSVCGQTAGMMLGFESVVRRMKPDVILVLGDTNCTVAGARVAADHGLPLVHVEAGLRSFDRTMPEEINRIWTDSVASLCLCTERAGVENMIRENVAARVLLVGNTMVDALRIHRDAIVASRIVDRLGLRPMEYALLTLHRRAAVADAQALRALVARVRDAVAPAPVVFPAHPRTANTLACGGPPIEGVAVVPALGYHDFAKLEAEARIVLTDSGGVQEETTALGVPCLTLRENTERPCTVDVGTNEVVGADGRGLEAAVARWKGRIERGWTALDAKRPALWDGHAAERVVAEIVNHFGRVPVNTADGRN